MSHFGGTAGCARGEIAALDHRHAKTTHDRLQSHACPSDSTADYENVPFSLAQLPDILRSLLLTEVDGLNSLAAHQSASKGLHTRVPLLQLSHDLNLQGNVLSPSFPLNLELATQDL
jgi:hypothetical protein